METVDLIVEVEEFMRVAARRGVTGLSVGVPNEIDAREGVDSVASLFGVLGRVFTAGLSEVERVTAEGEGE